MIRNFVPHKKNNFKSHLLRSPALLGYISFLLAIFLAIQFVPKKFPGVLGFASDINVSDLLTFTNQKRSSVGVGEVQLDPVLSSAAYKKAKDMFEDNYWAHVAPDGTEPWDFILGEGYDYIYAGENLARDFNTSRGVVEAWMNSPSHRENLLNGRYTDIGFAVVDGVLDGYETTLVVQFFGKRRAPAFLANNNNAPQEDISTPAQEGSSAAPALNVPSPVSLEGPSITGIPVQSSNEGIIASLPNEIVKRFEERGSVLPAVDVFRASRAISLVVGIFIFLLLLADAVVTAKRGVIRISGSVLAHSTLLILSILALWVASLPGLIL